LFLASFPMVSWVSCTIPNTIWYYL